MKRVVSLVLWAALAFIVYAYVVQWPNPELWQWLGR